MTQLSIVIPVFNEAEHLVDRLHVLSQFLKTQSRTVEVILVDGGSDDNTIPLAKAYADRIISSGKGRATQMNAGAAVASGEWLLFLHIDTQLPSIDFLSRALPQQWGFFAVRLSGKSCFFRIIERMITYRSRATSVATGDQCLFIKKNLFEQLGGFANIPLMEDVEITKRLRKTGQPYCVQTPVITSSRRWEKKGIFRTVILMWYLRGLYFLGVSPYQLAKKYYTHE